VRCWGTTGGFGSSGTVVRDVFEFGETRPIQVATGVGHTCALLNDGSIQCWGNNPEGELGVPNGGSTEAFPVEATHVTVAMSRVFTGDHASCGLTQDETLMCWGYNGFNQLGLGDNSVNSRFPQPATLFGDAIVDHAMAENATEANACALSRKSLRCYGRASASTEPEIGIMQGLTLPVAFENGQSLTCAVEASGILRCWGWNANGQLGIGNTSEEGFGSLVSPLSDVASVAVGYTHVCAIKNDAQLYCWGNTGVDGVGHSEPYLITELDEVVQVSAGEDFTCAITADGRVWCWGSNRFGQLGLDTSDPFRAHPTKPVAEP